VFAAALLGLGATACGGSNQSGGGNTNSITVKLVDGRGTQVGTAVLSPVALAGSGGSGTASASAGSSSSNGVRFQISVSGLAPGSHPLRITSEGRCDPPDFATSGALFSPPVTTTATVGHSAGTLPALPVGDDGKGGADLVDDLVTLDRGPANSLHSPRGTALLVGAASGPLACGVLSAPAPVSPTPSPSPTPTPSPTPVTSTTTTTVTVTRTSTSSVVATPAPTPIVPTPTPTPLGLPTP
jgi:Cu-Zn family superoxide dismutase